MTTRISNRLAALRTENIFLPFLYETQTLTIFTLYHKTNGSRCCRPYSTRNTFSNIINPVAPSESVNCSAPSTSGSPLQPSAVKRSNTRVDFLKRASAMSTRISELSSGSCSTMTRTEKVAFRKLLDKLKTSTPSPQERAKQNSAGQQKHVSPNNFLPRNPDESEESEISLIFNAALQGLKRGQASEPRAMSKNTTGHKPSSILPLKIEVNRMSKRIEKLREFNIHDIDDSGNSDDQINLSRVITLVVQRESEKIESALQAAIDKGEGDIGVWKICEERVFGMLRHLEGSTSEASSSSYQEMTSNSAILKPVNSMGSHDKDALAIDDQASKAHSGPLDIPSFVPKFPVISALYSHLLLVAFRMLNTHFPGSPLISQICPVMRSHGRTSVVLGGSTMLYNELMSFYWRVCDDLSTVVSLLKEMEVTGADFDSQTLRLVQAIISTRRTEAKVYPKCGSANRNHEVWRDTVPNTKALRELAGSGLADGWVRRIRRRLLQIQEREKFEKQIKEESDWDVTLG